jgi:tRNA-dihydrouridine synthase 4
VVANGDIFSLDDARKTREMCGVHGVMSARGLQENPALFAGHDRIPLAGIEVNLLLPLWVFKHNHLCSIWFLVLQRFLSLSAQHGFMFPLFHRHLADMLGPWFSSREEKKFFNMLSSPPSVIDFLEVRDILSALTLA